jgi:hypothetical protein
MVSDAISQPSNIFKTSMNDWSSKSDIGEGRVEAWLPQTPVIPLRSQICPEAEHEFGNNFARRCIWASGIVDSRVDFVL